MAGEGRADIEVRGDVRNFARQTERDLDRALSKIKTPKIKVKGELDIDRDRADLSFSKIARSAGEKITSALGSAISGLGSAIGPVVGIAGAAIGGTLVAAMVAVVLPTLAAAITSALAIGVGAGLIGLGAIALRNVKPLQKAVERLGDTLNSVLRKAAGPLIKPFERALKDITGLVKALGPTFKSIFSQLVPAIKPLTDAFSGFAKEALGGLRDSMPGITAAFEGLSRALPTVGRWIGDFFRTVFSNSGLIDNTTEAITKLVFGPLKLLGPLLSGLNVIFGALNNFFKIAAVVWDDVRASLLNFVDGGTGALARLKESWGPLGDAIKAVWDRLKEFAGADTMGEIERAFGDLVASVKELWAPLKDFLSTVWEETLAFIKRLWTDNFIPWWNSTGKPALTSAIKAAFGAAWEAAKALAAAKIAETVERTRSGLSAMAGAVRGALVSIPAIVGSLINAAADRAISGAGKIVSGVLGKLRSLAGQVRSALGAVRSAVTGAFAGAGGWLVSAGRQIIDGLISGIRSAFGRVQGILSSLTASLPSWKGPAEVDRKILEDSGRMVIAGFERGMVSEFGSIRKQLESLTGDLPAWTAGRPRGGDGSSAGGTNMGPTTITVNVSGATGADAGERAAEVILERLGQARLASG